MDYEQYWIPHGHFTDHYWYPMGGQGTGSPVLRGDLPMEKSRRRPAWMLPVVVTFILLAVTGLIIGLVVYFTSPGSGTTTTAPETTTNAPTAVSTCISCTSSTDATCTAVSAPSTTVQCEVGRCYLQKEFDSGAISRGCISSADISSKRMHAPGVGSGVNVCSSNPPGQSSANPPRPPIICICEGINCNDGTNTFTKMSGAELEKLGVNSYNFAFSCSCPATPCNKVHFISPPFVVPGCDCSCTQLP